ncbi:MurR/RpiR family transcriptional regulator [Vagococcus lutrae]|nr:MurR/RpiR family transcriptional regulator [Vagococcus lutrae]MDT2801487.1 MurR/RpiR family transcriptional regulator [Vagococcus lutrae]MDY3706456.1 MurR/RpiR family transcriptional regulator [Vagococcus lutrae]UQF71988.1 MurR/RpiR family transcriptional regulator [Vagococcus lutrae]WEB81328.1 MurR/RpiR family transcriptional regulator [Vagococcus lutrae]
MGVNVLIKIKENLELLSKSERKLAEWILQYPKDVIHMTVTGLAKEADSSPATIVRLCHSLGLAGFPDLKLQLSAIPEQVAEDLLTDIVPDESLDQLKKKLRVKLDYAFDETVERLKNKELEQALAWMRETTVFYTYGLGASGLVANDIYQKLSRIGRSVMNEQDHHLLATAMVTQQAPALLFAISNSGEKPEVLKLMEVAKNKGIKVVGLTSRRDSTLAKQADVTLLTATGGEAPLRSSATNSLLVQLFAVDILFSAFASQEYEYSLQKLNDSKEVISQYFEKSSRCDS